MKRLLIALIFILFCFIIVGSRPINHKQAANGLPKGDTGYILNGKWVRMSMNGPISLSFNDAGEVNGDLNDDGTIEIFSTYNISQDTIIFNDKEGVACPEGGKYKIKNSPYYIAFNLIDDNCNGRIKTMMGYWVRPRFEEQIGELSSKIEQSNNYEDILCRARIFLAIGKADLAKRDLDECIARDSTNGDVFLNRAATRFSTNDLKGIIADCNQAMTLDPNNKNAYFLRGLAHYGLGKKAEACDDFQVAIQLGFAVLREAEKEKCEEFWESFESRE